MDREALQTYILEQYQAEADHPWLRHPKHTVFRHGGNKKWFALIMNVTRDVLNKDGNTSPIDILNVKISPAQGEELRKIPGIYPAYHMNHKTWISVVLDETLPDEKIGELINTSYQLTTT